MVRNVAPLVRDLQPSDFHLLSGVEHGMRFSEWVDRGRIPDFSNLDEQEVGYRLDRCLDRELLERRTLQYEGYQLTFEGYDALALHTFSERETISAVGALLGEGKESDVLEAKNGSAVALKFHREGLTNFREVQKERDYTADRHHVSWIYTARIAAKREFDALEALFPDVAVPEPIDHNRHAIVMGKMVGSQLSRTRVDDSIVIETLAAILHEIAVAYRAGYVHADISEFNVFVDGLDVTIFDWPQAVEIDHPNAEELLERDVRNILSYFNRKYPDKMGQIQDTSDVLELVRRRTVGKESLMADN